MEKVICTFECLLLQGSGSCGFLEYTRAGAWRS